MKKFLKVSKKQRHHLLSVLDIGTSKIACAVVRLKPGHLTSQNVNLKQSTFQKNESLLKVLSFSYQASAGVKNGKITRFDVLEESILTAIHSVEKECREILQDLYVSVPSICTTSFFMKKKIHLKNQIVTDSDIKFLLTINTEALKESYILHVFPLLYVLDNNQEITDPRGMIGKELEVYLHIIFAPNTYIQNLKQLIGRCHLDVKAFVASSYASSLSTLLEDEMMLGVTLVDIGAGCTSVASFHEGKMVFLKSFPFGGELITKDIAQGLCIPISEAERLKTLYGTLMYSSRDDHENIHVLTLERQHYTNKDRQHITKSQLTHIIRSRVEEMFDIISTCFNEQEINSIALQRIVVTGGTAQLQGIVGFIQNLWNAPVRLGTPLSSFSNVSSFLTQHDHFKYEKFYEQFQNSSFAVILGLIRYAAQDQMKNQWPSPLISAYSFFGSFFNTLNLFLEKIMKK